MGEVNPLVADHMKVAETLFEDRGRVRRVGRNDDERSSFAGEVRDALFREMGLGIHYDEGNGHLLRVVLLLVDPGLGKRPPRVQGEPVGTVLQVVVLLQPFFHAWDVREVSIHVHLVRIPC